MSDERPNILFIMSDEHDPGVIGCYGDSIVSTPNLDKLANDGVLFDNCYTTSPLCVPARLSFTSGKYISRVGAWNNHMKLESDSIPSLPRVLNERGYDTILCGKQHYDKTRRYGFKFDLLPHHNTTNKTNKGDRRKSLHEKGTNGRGFNRRSSHFHVGNSSPTLDLDLEKTGKAVEFFENRKSSDKPFFFFLGYLAPHFPLIVPEEYYEKYKDKVPMPEIPEGLIKSLPKNYQALRKGFGFENPKPEIVKKGRELYWALTEWLDNQIGIVLEALRNSEVADNTIIVYISDHGENKGDHALWWKNAMYDHSARIPFIINYPKKWKSLQKRNKACSMVDVVQTIVDVTGSSCPTDWDGNSLLPYINDPNYPWKDFALSEYYGHNIFSGITAVRTGDYKYVYHNKSANGYSSERELYNIKEDPKEFVNLALDPQYEEKCKEMHQKIIKELGKDPDFIEDYFYEHTKLRKPFNIGKKWKFWNRN